MLAQLEQEEHARRHVSRGRRNRMDIKSFANKSVFESMLHVGIMSIVQPSWTRIVVEVLRVE